MSLDAKPRLVDRVRQRLPLKHYSYRTEQQYVLWIRRFVLFHDKRHPESMGPAEVEAFLNDLAVRQRVSAATQNQALAAILFLYRHVLDRDLPWLDHLIRAKKPQRLPVVLSARETRAVLSQPDGVYWLIGNLLMAVACGSWSPSVRRARATWPGAEGRLCGCRVARCQGTKVPARCARTDLAVCVSGHQALDRSAQWRVPAPSHLRRLGAASDEDCRAPRGH